MLLGDGTELLFSKKKATQQLYYSPPGPASWASNKVLREGLLMEADAFPVTVIAD